MADALEMTLREVVIRQAGRDGWDALLRASEIRDEDVLSHSLDADAKRRLVVATCETLHLHWLATFGGPVSGSLSPRLSYSWLDDKTLVMEYQSHRHLVDLLVALMEVLADRNELLRVRRTGVRSVEVGLAA